jgi:hypothetical protein
LCLGRSFGAGRKDSQGFRLWRGVQYRRLQGAGRWWSRNRASLKSEAAAILKQRPTAYWPATAPRKTRSQFATMCDTDRIAARLAPFGYTPATRSDETFWASHMVWIELFETSCRAGSKPVRETFGGYGFRSSGVGMQGFLGPLHSYPSSNSHLVRPPRWPVSPPPRGLNLHSPMHASVVLYHRQGWCGPCVPQGSDSRQVHVTSRPEHVGVLLRRQPRPVSVPDL